MIIKDAKTGRIYYSTEGDKEYLVTGKFWKALEAGDVHYRWGGQKSEEDSIIYYTTRETLDLKSRAFEEMFEAIANSEVGKLVMSGQLSITTIM